MLTDAVSKAVLASAPEGLFVFDRHGRIVFVNSQAEELFGYASTELVGKDFGILFPRLARENRAPEAPTSISISAITVALFGREQKGVRKDGTEIGLQVSIAGVNAHDEPLSCCIVRKTAAANLGSESLSALSDHFRQMVENSHDILCIRDADGRIRYTSPSILHVMGYKQEEMIGSTGFDLLHPDDRSNVEEALTGFWSNPGARGSIQYRAKHANGSWVSLEVTAYNLLDHPAIQGVVLNGRDISKRKQDEAGKDQLIAELQQTLANVKTLTGVLPICASCKKIQEGDQWQQIEAYIRDRSQLEFSHTMCPECTSLWYPDLNNN